jgi:hypothetical protein
MITVERCLQKALPTHFRRSKIIKSIYAPQTKILENRKTFRTVVLSTFFKGVSIRFGPRFLEKCSTRRSEMFFGFLKSFGEHRIVCSPNEDFRTSKNMWVRPVVSTFHTPNYSIWAKSDEKCLQQVLPTYFATFKNLRLGSINSKRKEKE